LCNAQAVNYRCFQRNPRSPARCRAFLCVKVPGLNGCRSRFSRGAGWKLLCRDAPGLSRDAFAAEHEPEPFALPDVIHLPTIDQVVRVRYKFVADTKSIRYHYVGGVLTLTGQTRSDKLCVKALRRWLSTTARREFEPRLRALSVLTEAPFKKIQVRAQRTCWGSRSSTGTISINLCLLFLTPDLTRYLMIHELCHGRHMNHSKRFWRLVASYEPEYRELDRKLTESWRQVPTWLGLY